MRCKSPVSSALKRLGNNLTSVLLKDIYIYTMYYGIAISLRTYLTSADFSTVLYVNCILPQKTQR